MMLTKCWPVRFWVDDLNNNYIHGGKLTMSWLYVMILLGLVPSHTVLCPRIVAQHWLNHRYTSMVKFMCKRQ